MRENAFWTWRDQLPLTVFWFVISLCGIAPLLAMVVVAQKPAHPQQLVYVSQASLANGARVGIFLPANPVALGLQSKSGSRVLTIGDVLNCRPFVEQTEVFRKTPAGALETGSESQEFLNCGPPRPGEPDRILAIVGIQWRE
jgi:hypothetical protein